MMTFIEKIEPPPPLVPLTDDEQLKLRLEAIAREDLWVKNFIDRLAGVVRDMKHWRPCHARPIHPREIHPRTIGRPKVRQEYFERFPKDRYQTEVESWRHLQSDNIVFTMKHLREPVDSE
jgi:hypothetical protein